MKAGPQVKNLKVTDHDARAYDSKNSLDLIQKVVLITLYYIHRKFSLELQFNISLITYTLFDLNFCNIYLSLVKTVLEIVILLYYCSNSFHMGCNLKVVKWELLKLVSVVHNCLFSYQSYYLSV